MKIKNKTLSPEQITHKAFFVGASLEDNLSAIRGYKGTHLAYQMFNEVSIVANTVKTINDELFRNGIDFQPAFIKKCNKCGFESQESIEECPLCKSSDLRDPDPKEKLKFYSTFGQNFMQKANDYNESLLKVLEIVGYHTEISNRPAIFIQKEYFISNGKLMSRPLGIYPLDPRYITPVFNTQTGKQGGLIRICPMCRHEFDRHVFKCDKCGCETKDAFYKTQYPQSSVQYYTENEILMRSKYGYEIFGVSLLFKIKDEIESYHMIERRILSFLEYGRVPGMMIIQTLNPDEFNLQWDKMKELQQANPFNMPVFTVDPDAKFGANYINTMQEPSEQTLKIKDDLRQRIGALYGVSPVLQNDTATSGGLNNESQQLVVSNRAIEKGQKFINENILPWICAQFGIKDWVLKLNPAEDADLMRDNTLLALQLDNMEKALRLSLDVEFKDNQLTVSGKPTKPEEPTIQDEARRLLNDPANTDLDNDKAGEPESGKIKTKSAEIISEEEYIKGQFPNFHCVKAGRLDKVINAMLKIKRKVFAGLTQKETEEIYSSMVRIMASDKWGLEDIEKTISEKVPLDSKQIETIARTETHAILETARMIDYKDTEKDKGKKYNYVWVGANDSRTTPICRAIKERVGDGVPLEELEKIIEEESNKYYSKINSNYEYRYMTPHINCRHHARKVMKL